MRNSSSLALVTPDQEEIEHFGVSSQSLFSGDHLLQARALCGGRTASAKRDRIVRPSGFASWRLCGGDVSLDAESGTEQLQAHMGRQGEGSALHDAERDVFLPTGENPIPIA